MGESKIIEPNYLSISACFPAYNDGGTIASMVIMAHATLREVSDDFEILVCNDGSSDYTPRVLDALRERYPELRVIHHPQNQGYGCALRSDFAHATKEFIFYTDGDAQYDVRELKLLVEAMAPGVDVVNGYKISRNDPVHRLVIGWLYHYLMKLLFGYRIRDVDCDFRLIRRRCFEAIYLESSDGTLPLEMVKKFHDAGFVFAEVPVHHYHRVYGRSQFFNWRRLIRAVHHIIRLWVKLVWRKEHLKARESGEAPAKHGGGGKVSDVSRSSRDFPGDG